MNAKQRTEPLTEKPRKEVDGQFILMNRAAFKIWLENQTITRQINLIQNHHTWRPSYKNFDGSNQIDSCRAMKRSHLKRGFNDIAQQITTFNDGTIVVCRPFNKAPAGIKGANSYGICMEHVGNFDIDGDIMTDEHKETIIFLNAVLCKKFGLDVNTDTVVYHHWWTAAGKRTNGINAAKSCPGTNFFGGNSVESAEKNFIPLIKAVYNEI